jgi:N6-adenosine-specific RNA methylase IME4
VKIDEEFRSLIPPLKTDERKDLEQSIVAEGCRDAIVAWNDTIVDGHNRYEICTAHDIPFQTVSRDFPDRDAAKVWILTNQLGRRNLPPYVQIELREQRRALLRDEGRERQAEGVRAANKKRWHGDESVLSTLDKTDRHDTQKQIASDIGVGTGTVARAQYVIEHAPDEIKEQARAGEFSVNQAYKETKRYEKKKEQDTYFAELREKEIDPPSGEYDVVVIDPPWPIEKVERDVRPNQHGKPYRTMTVEEIRDETIIPASQNCHVFLWTTHRFLPDALRLLLSWELRYVCMFVWRKPGGFQPIGLPQYNCEFVLYARKGSPKFVDTKAFPVCFDAPRGQHSEKPDVFFETLCRCTAGRRISIYERKQRDGFDSWGDEA